METRQLDERDRSAAEAFLVKHRDSSMFLRSNIRRAGFTFSGRPFEATYMAVFDAGRIVAVIAHSWNGMLMVQAPVEAEALAHALVRASGRRVTGFSGPREQVRHVRTALGLLEAPAQMDEDEDLYGLQLEALRVPARMEEIVCRPAQPQDRDTLLQFRLAYEIEALGGGDDAQSRERVATFLDAQLAAGHVWVALAAGKLVSLSAFNAALPDIVQLGGIFTPPEQRGRSYAKHAVGAQLLAARSAGANRSVLFTKNPSAVRCYEALGFVRLSEFALVLLNHS
ncbi:MAG TPA: GNAT family N-acetyltransferase [Polyangiales bacterium]|nr:GNAT family N-acetyltransferase [Polyangiales bacterium]